MNSSIPYYTAGTRPCSGCYMLPGQMPYYPTPFTGILSSAVSQAGLSSPEDGLNRDMEYMKQLYPKAAKHIQKEIEEECDKLEYEGSFMFDDYPDPIRLHVLADSIYGRLKDTGFGDITVAEVAAAKEETAVPSDEEEDMPEAPPEISAEQLPVFCPSCCPGRYCPPPEPDYRPDGSPNWLRSLIQIMLYQEMLHRRKRYRDRRRWY